MSSNLGNLGSWTRSKVKLMKYLVGIIEDAIDAQLISSLVNWIINLSSQFLLN